MLQHRTVGRYGREYAAVLDLKSVYDTVNIAKLFVEVEKRISFNVAAIISHPLCSSKFITQGYETEKEVQGTPEIPNNVNVQDRTSFPAMHVAACSILRTERYKRPRDPNRVSRAQLRRCTPSTVI